MRAHRKSDKAHSEEWDLHVTVVQAPLNGDELILFPLESHFLLSSLYTIQHQCVKLQDATHSFMVLCTAERQLN